MQGTQGHGAASALGAAISASPGHPGVPSGPAARPTALGLPSPHSRCTMGRWECEERPCPRRCALEGGSFVTTFDARPYRFHGTCTYVLLQVGHACLRGHPGDPPGGLPQGHHKGSRQEGSPRGVEVSTSFRPSVLTTVLSEPPAPLRGLPDGRIRQVWVLALGDVPDRSHLRVQPGKAAPPAAAAPTQVHEQTCPHRVPGPVAPPQGLQEGATSPNFQHVTRATLPPGQNRDFSGRCGY